MDAASVECVIQILINAYVMKDHMDRIVSNPSKNVQMIVLIKEFVIIWLLNVNVLKDK